jgi:hypothetical protein
MIAVHALRSFALVGVVFFSLYYHGDLAFGLQCAWQVGWCLNYWRLGEQSCSNNQEMLP